MVAVPTQVEARLAFAIAQHLVERFGFRHSSNQRWGVEGYKYNLGNDSFLTTATAQISVETALEPERYRVVGELDCVAGEIYRCAIEGPCTEKAEVSIQDLSQFLPILSVTVTMKPTL